MAQTVPGNQRFLDRVTFRPVTRPVVNATANILFTVAVANIAMIGGQVLGTVSVANATEVQTQSFVATFAAVNKAGTLTMQANTVATGTVNTAGTFVVTLAVADQGGGSGVMQFTANVASGLATPTTIQIEYIVVPHKGTVVYS